MFACRELLNVAREAVLQGIESLADIPPQRFWQRAELLAGFVADQKAVARAGIGSASAAALTRLVCHRFRYPQTAVALYPIPRSPHGFLLRPKADASHAEHTPMHRGATVMNPEPAKVRAR